MVSLTLVSIKIVGDVVCKVIGIMTVLLPGIRHAESVVRLDIWPVFAGPTSVVFLIQIMSHIISLKRQCHNLE